jgi:hypothetical protein
MADQKAPAQPENANNRTKTRSPSYPSAGLETCVKWTRRVWDAEKKSTMAALVAGKAMGYNTMSGATRVALSAMKKFGLLTEEGPERVRVSDEAIRYFLHPDEEEKLRILRSFARKPSIIAEILAEAVDELPSDENLSFRLVTDKGFSEDAAKTFIKALKETVRFAKLGPEHYGQGMPSPSEQAPDGSAEQRTAARATPPGAMPPLVAPGALRGSGTTGGAGFRFDWPDGTHVNIQLSAAPGADTIEELIDYLNVFQKKLKRQSAPTSSPKKQEDKTDEA